MKIIIEIQDLEAATSAAQIPAAVVKMEAAPEGEQPAAPVAPEVFDRSTATDAGSAPSLEGAMMGPMIQPPAGEEPRAMISGVSDMAAGAAPTEMTMNTGMEGE